MDIHILAFIALAGLMILVAITAIAFTYSEGDEHSTQDKRIRYKNIRRINTNTIETVNLSGDVEQWQRTA